MGYAGHYTGLYSGKLAGTPYPSTLNPHTFDSKTGRPQRALVIDAMIDLLSPLDRQNGGYLEAIEGITTIARGPGDDKACAEIMEWLTGRAPSIVIATGDMDFETAGDVDRWRAPLRVHVYFFVFHRRDLFEGPGMADVVQLADGQADPGVFVAMEHARMLLAAKVPGVAAASELKPLTERRIETDGDFEIWEQIYMVHLSQIINSKRNVTLELKQINSYSRVAGQLDTDEPIVSIETKGLGKQ